MSWIENARVQQRGDGGHRLIAEFKLLGLLGEKIQCLLTGAAGFPFVLQQGGERNPAIPANYSKRHFSLIHQLCHEGRRYVEQVRCLLGCELFAEG